MEPVELSKEDISALTNKLGDGTNPKQVGAFLNDVDARLDGTSLAFRERQLNAICQKLEADGTLPKMMLGAGLGDPASYHYQAILPAKNAISVGKADLDELVHTARAKTGDSHNLQYVHASTQLLANSIVRNFDEIQNGEKQVNYALIQDWAPTFHKRAKPAGQDEINALAYQVGMGRDKTRVANFLSAVDRRFTDVLQDPRDRQLMELANKLKKTGALPGVMLQAGLGSASETFNLLSGRRGKLGQKVINYEIAHHFSGLRNADSSELKPSMRLLACAFSLSADDIQRSDQLNGRRLVQWEQEFRFSPESISCWAKEAAGNSQAGGVPVTRTRAAGGRAETFIEPAPTLDAPRYSPNSRVPLEEQAGDSVSQTFSRSRADRAPSLYPAHSAEGERSDAFGPSYLEGNRRGYGPRFNPPGTYRPKSSSYTEGDREHHY